MTKFIKYSSGCAAIVFSIFALLWLDASLHLVGSWYYPDGEPVFLFAQQEVELITNSTLKYYLALSISQLIINGYVSYRLIRKSTIVSRFMCKR